MKRNRHNKKRNTAVLYETLIRELTRSAARGEKRKKLKILSILKENFSKNSILFEELQFYKALSEKNNYKKEVATKILSETKRQHNKLNKASLFRAQSKVIKQINYELGSDIFENFIPSFKNFATIYQVLNESGNPKNIVLFEEQIIENLSRPKEEKEEKYKAINKLAFKSFLEKFNTKYSSSLLNEQKELLSLYSTSFKNNDLELKIFLNEEVGRLKSILDSLGKKIIEEENRKSILDLLNTFSTKSVDKVMLEKILKVQKLISEISKNGN